MILAYTNASNSALLEAIPVVTTQTMPPSIAFPETPERRTEITRQIQCATGLDENLAGTTGARILWHRERRDPGDMGIPVP